ncbi:MAG: TnsD family transposase [Nitrospiraceae bacterium]|nr:TnsD family transposase [Nitrospiraceae bacterium]
MRTTTYRSCIVLLTMAIYLPAPYPDEVLYSILARHRLRLGQTTTTVLMRQLFGSPSVHAAVAFPTHLSHLSSTLHPHANMTLDTLIMRFTLFPYYAPFFARDHRLALYQRMAADHHGMERAVPMTWLRRNSVTVSEMLRYCPVCAAHERRELGEAYWHRLHQIPGVEVCAVHEVWLESTCAPARALGGWHHFLSAESAILSTAVRHLSAYEPGRNSMIQLTHDAAWLLEQNPSSSDPEALWSRYRCLLRERGLSSYRGKVSPSKLLALIHRLFPVTFLARIEGNSGRLTSGRGIFSLIRKPRGGLPPLYHLLMMQVLDKSAEEFFQLPAKPHDFGIGPWPCLNRLAPHYKAMTVMTYSVHVQKDGGRPVATFSCPCGFVYSRIGPDWGPLARFSYTRIERYGPLWDRKFSRLWSTPENTLSFISQTVGMAEKNLSKHAARLKLPVWKRPTGHSAIPSRKRSWRGRMVRPLSATIRRVRQEWRNLSAQSGRSIHEEREERRLYHWLFRHDHDWLIAQPHRSRITRQAGSHTQVDWNERDQFLAHVLERQPLLPALSGHHRISINRLIRQSGYRHLIQPNLHRLPATRATLNRIVTSHMPED